jgi:hypothetical protein
MYCRGGVIEDLSWKACPPNYQYNANLDLANGPGFDSTFFTADFQPPGRQQSGPAYSTPVVPNSGGQQSLGSANVVPTLQAGQQIHTAEHHQAGLGAI